MLENSWSILQPLNKGIRPTRPSIMMFCKPHVQMLFEKCDCCGAKLWDLWFLLKNPFSKNNSLSFSPYFSLMFLISLHNNLHRLSQSNNLIGSNDFFCQGHPICSPHGGSLSSLPIPTHPKDEAILLQCLGVDLLVLPTKARILCLDSL